MDLCFKHFDGRKYDHVEVLDSDSGQVVGLIRSYFCGPGISVSLFDGKYSANVSSIEECRAFVKGVESVLTRLTSVDDGRKRLERELDRLKDKLSASPELA
jgi:hypothetical protein